MISVLDLRDPLCGEVSLAGGKAALLARAFTAGLPILPGRVVPAQSSRGHLARGAEALERSGSGGARRTVFETPLDRDLETRLLEAGAGLGGAFVVRSSAVTESGGEWSGAFTSYLDVGRADLPRAVVGCWASAFAPSTLDRYRAAGIEPGSIDMAVLIQPTVNPEFSGTAHLVDDGVAVTAVTGSPVPLVQGWEPGTHARILPGADPTGSAVELVGAVGLEEVASSLLQAATSMGCTGCEWAIVDDEMVLLQLTSHPVAAVASPTPSRVPGLDTPTARRVARFTRRFPGALGTELVLPWVLGTIPIPASSDFHPPGDIPVSMLMREATALARRLTSEVWSLPEQEAVDAAREMLTRLRGPAPRGALARIDELHPAQPGDARRLLGLVSAIRNALVTVGVVKRAELGWHFAADSIPGVLQAPPPAPRRVGVDRWDPFNVATIFANGALGQGVPASPGIGFGRMRWIGDSTDLRLFRPRDMIVARYPVPNLAPLLWDAAGVVTLGGNPGAHLFESARALGIPAAAGVDMETALGDRIEHAKGEHAMALDGQTGGVAITSW